MTIIAVEPIALSFSNTPVAFFMLSDVAFLVSSASDNRRVTDDFIVGVVVGLFNVCARQLLSIKRLSC